MKCITWTATANTTNSNTQPKQRIWKVQKSIKKVVAQNSIHRLLFNYHISHDRHLKVSQKIALLLNLIQCIELLAILFFLPIYLIQLTVQHQNVYFMFNNFRWIRFKWWKDIKENFETNNETQTHLCKINSIYQIEWVNFQQKNIEIKTYFDLLSK